MATSGSNQVREGRLPHRGGGRGRLRTEQIANIGCDLAHALGEESGQRTGADEIEPLLEHFGPKEVSVLYLIGQHLQTALIGPARFIEELLDGLLFVLRFGGNFLDALGQAFEGGDQSPASNCSTSGVVITQPCYRP